MNILRRIQLRHRQRQAALAERIRLLEQLDRPDRYPSVSKEWQALFADPAWQRPAAGHDGRCGRCGAAVEAHERRCAQCGAVWEKSKGRKLAIYLYFVFSVIVSVILGYVLSIYIHNLFLSHPRVNKDFAGFIESYLWVSGTILFVLIATIIIEKIDRPSRAAWRQQDQDGH
jgi:predicted nucleic acid-binding Zn ribbon protein